jgi:hypothetical protein
VEWQLAWYIFAAPDVHAYAKRAKLDDAVIEIWCDEELLWKREFTKL